MKQAKRCGGRGRTGHIAAAAVSREDSPCSSVVCTPDIAIAVVCDAHRKPSTAAAMPSVYKEQDLLASTESRSRSRLSDRFLCPPLAFMEPCVNNTPGSASALSAL